MNMSTQPSHTDLETMMDILREGDEFWANRWGKALPEDVTEAPDQTGFIIGSERL